MSGGAFNVYGMDCSHLSKKDLFRNFLNFACEDDLMNKDLLQN